MQARATLGQPVRDDFWDAALNVVNDIEQIVARMDPEVLLELVLELTQNATPQLMTSIPLLRSRHNKACTTRMYEVRGMQEASNRHRGERSWNCNPEIRSRQRQG